MLKSCGCSLYVKKGLPFLHILSVTGEKFSSSAAGGMWNILGEEHKSQWRLKIKLYIWESWNWRKGERERERVFKLIYPPLFSNPFFYFFLPDIFPPFQLFFSQLPRSERRSFIHISVLENITWFISMHNQNAISLFMTLWHCCA